MITYIVDTHALVWFLEKNPRLTDAARVALLNPEAQIVIPTIVLTEIVFLYSKKKISIDLSIVLSDVPSSSNCTVYPLDEEVVLRLPTNLDIHDAILVATGLLYRDLMEHDVAIISKDEMIKQANLIRPLGKGDLMQRKSKRAKPFVKIIVEHDVVVTMPPRRKISTQAKITRIRKAEPRIVTPENTYLGI